MPDAAKWRRWTRLQTVAWIAFRDHRAVQVAAEVEARAEDERPANLYSYLALEGALRTVRLKGEKADKPGKAVADAIQQLEAAEQAGKLVPDNSGRFRVAEIKTLFSSREGRGSGQLPRNEVEYRKTVELGWFFLTDRKDRTNRGHSWDGVLAWCIEEELIKTRKQYEKLRPAALKFAEKELELRWHHNVGITNHKQPLSRGEYEQYRLNLKSWKMRGRPAKGA
jgi:hypothetical protein